jgi:uncharacterized protein (TIGR02246 family)
MTEGADANDPVQVVERQLAAWRAGDAPAFAACFAPDCRAVSLPSGALVADGRAEIERIWGARFRTQPRRARILSRIVDQGLVIDHEELEVIATGETRTAVAMFRVDGGLITHFWLVHGAVEPPPPTA